ncbi:MAG: hypothetical protein KIPDCIKN_04239 [Haliscomenobacter sp.]|nr:hypothetical protein [Haliscomenobacter sp.]
MRHSGKLLFCLKRFVFLVTKKLLLRKMKHKKSFAALVICYAFFIGAVFFYYPKWNLNYSEAPISWDVSGYYFYLPAAFIYKDVKYLFFKDRILHQYQPTKDFEQGYQLPNGNYVLKYSCGQAILFSPFFFLAHWYAKANDTFPADGFSVPYQFMISMGCLLMAFLGMWVLRRILLRYFSDFSVAVSLILLVLGTNYFEYGTLGSALTHSNLFTLYALLILLTIRFYEKPTYWKAVGIGSLVGLAALVRPTEILSALIPLLWGLTPNFRSSLADKMEFFKTHLPKLALAVAACLLVGSVQLIYWKTVSGHWLVYSYGSDQGFDWLSPHFHKGIFGYRCGWLVYSPMLIFALVGFVSVFRQQRQFALAGLIFFILFSYVVFSWNIWWYGGTLGHRAMVQSYPVLAFPLTAFVGDLLKTKRWKYVFAPVALLFICLNLWWSHQAHKGRLFQTEQMNRAYFWAVLGKFKVPEETLKLLDTNEPLFRGTRKNVKRLVYEDFEKDTSAFSCDMPPIEGLKSACLNAEQQMTPGYSAPLTNGEARWVRVGAVFRCRNKEWDLWRNAQLVVAFTKGQDKVKDKFIRVYRFLNDGETEYLYFDTRAPRKAFDRVTVYVWNSGGALPLLVDQLKLETFDE